MTVTNDHFPPTPRTLVHEALDRGDHASLAAHLMAIYEQPLMVYFGATSYRGLGPPRDVVAGFFAARLAREDWLRDWRDSCAIRDIPLRRWLLNALNFYLKEEVRRLARDRRTEGTGDVPQLASEARAAEVQFEREAARSIVGEALRRAREACESAGQSTHFEIFMRHFIDEHPYDRLAHAFGLSESQCAGHARTASAKFRRALMETLLDEGADPSGLDDEIASLLGALRP